MFFKLTLVCLGLMCMANCKPVDEISIEDSEEMEEFGKTMINFLNEMTRTIESYLNPVFELFAMLENAETKDIPNIKPFPFEIQGAEENEISDEIHDKDFNLELVMPIGTSNTE